MSGQAFRGVQATASFGQFGVVWAFLFFFLLLLLLLPLELLM